MADATPTTIPVMLALTPYATKDSATIGDQRVHRGGLTLVGQANAAAGGGNVYVAICSGGLFTVDPATGHATLVGDGTPAHPTPTTYGPTNYLRLFGSQAVCQPTFDWLTLAGASEPGYLYSCVPTL